MTVGEGTLQAMMARYGDKEGNVRFDDFVACYIKLKSMQSMSSAAVDSVMWYSYERVSNPFQLLCSVFPC